MSYSTRFPKLAVLGALALFAVAPFNQAEAQFGKKLKDAAKRTAEDKAVQKVVDEEGKVIDTLLSGGGEAARPADSTVAPGQAAPAAPAAAVPAAGAGATPAASGETATAKPGEGVWVNYDFVPGTRSLFVEDFSKDNVGDFPKRLEFIDGNMEVAERGGMRVLRVTSRPGKFAIKLTEPLPERFTLEFDAVTEYAGDYLILRFNDKATEDVRFRLHDGKGQGGVFGGTKQSLGFTSRPITPKETFRGRIMADGKYVKVYINDTRVGNIPNAEIGRSNQILVEFPGSEEAPGFLANVSVMEGGKKLYDALAEKGRVATQGIYFDTGSDRIRPESTPTLKEIGTMLKEHADLKLTIEGHTDNVGSAPANQTLSEKRAAAVRQYLIDTYQVEGVRLQAKGLGQTKPAGSNDTPEGRQQNRRVELVRG
jgi:outer membrane protein OmpA-like peptidoglycan-associated protein